MRTIVFVIGLCVAVPAWGEECITEKLQIQTLQRENAQLKAAHAMSEKRAREAASQAPAPPAVPPQKEVKPPPPPQ